MNNFDIQALLQATRPPVAATPRLAAVPTRRVDGASAGCYAVDLDEHAYHRGTAGISSTGLKQLMRSPAHYRAWADTRSDGDTAARRFGRAVHCRVLERPEFDRRHVVWHGVDRRAAGYKEFEQAHAARTILSADEMARVEGCEQALLSDSAFPLAGYLGGADDDGGHRVVEPACTEFTIVWVDDATGVTCKVRLDAVGFDPLIALDLKTCGDARPGAFTRDIVRMNYDLQAAFYMEGLRRYTGREGTFVFAAVEGERPHGVAFYALAPDHDLMLNGARKFRHALDLYARCTATGRWPAYAFGRLIEPEMAPWMVFEPGE